MPAERCRAHSPGGPRRGYAHWSLQEFAGSTLRALWASRAGLRLQRASGREAPEEEKRPTSTRRALRLCCVGGVGARQARPSLPRVERRSHGLNPGALSAPGNPEFLGTGSLEAGKNGKELV